MIQNRSASYSTFLTFALFLGLMTGCLVTVLGQEKVQVFQLQHTSEDPIHDSPFLSGAGEGARESQDWKKISGKELHLYTEETWLVYYLTLSPEDQGQLYINLGSGANMEVYIPTDTSLRTYQKQETGPLVAAVNTSISQGNSWNERVLILPPARSFPIYIRATHVFHNEIRLRPHIQTYASWLEERQGYNLFLGIFYGAMLFLIVYHTFFFLILRDQTYAIHVLFMVSIVGFIGYHEGSTYAFLFPNSPYLNYFLNFLLGVIPIAYVLFYRSYLKLYQLSTKRDRWFRKSVTINIGLQLIPVLIFLGTGKTVGVYTLVHIINLIFILLYIGIFAGAFSLSNKDHLILLGGLAAMAGSGLIATLSQLLGYAINWKTVLEIGVLLEAIIFAVGLGYRTRRWEREKLRNSTQLIEQLKKTEELQLHFNQKLQSQVYERSQQLTEALRVAKQAAEVKSEFLTSMSHEMRTPLNGIIGLSNLMTEESDDSTKSQHLDELSDSAQDLLHLVNNVLDFSALEDQESTTQEEFSLTQSLSILERILGKRAARKGLTFTLLQPKNSLIVYADKRRIEQVLSNLTTNAIKYTESGSIDIIVEILGQNDTDLSLSFTIKDTGAGIKPEAMAEIFQPFHHSNEGFKRANRGSGLGLSVVSKILPLMGSTLDMSSQYGVGTTCTFVLTLPGKIQPTSVNKSTLALPSNPLEGKKILLVEDHIVNQKVGMKYLKKWGVEPDLAENGEIAVAMVQAKEYDMILMDLHMPVMDGITAAQTIKSLGNSYSTIPIIALSAATHLKEVQQQVIEAGMLDFVTKPFAPKDLRAKIEAYLYSSSA